MIPELEEKYKQFYRDGQNFLVNYYDPEYLSREYVKKLLDGKMEY